MTTYTPACGCPTCGRRPPVGFTADEVRRARRERQAARVVKVHCPRCGRYYWVRARDIAVAMPVPSGADSLPADFPGRTHLVRAGLGSIEKVCGADDLEDVPGIGPKTARQIQEILDRAGRAAVA